mmetsp:Transcript_1997/g.4803  ORF Transcript_1997/g.4803 Transcript_1997/m.4803 type:complete len:204 (+) Transcript_1997:479-1090(+)
MDRSWASSGTMSSTSWIISLLQMRPDLLRSYFWKRTFKFSTSGSVQPPFLMMAWRSIRTCFRQARTKPSRVTMPTRLISVLVQSGCAHLAKPALAKAREAAGMLSTCLASTSSSSKACWKSAMSRSWSIRTTLRNCRGPMSPESSMSTWRSTLCMASKLTWYPRSRMALGTSSDANCPRPTSSWRKAASICSSSSFRMPSRWR